MGTAAALHQQVQWYSGSVLDCYPGGPGSNPVWEKAVDNTRARKP